MSEIKTKILETIQRLQNDPATAGIYYPEITGQGVTIWALSGEFKGVNPKVLSDYLKSLVAEGKIKAIDPDVYGLPSFVLTEKRPCLTPCAPSDWRKGGKCDQNGCYHS